MNEHTLEQLRKAFQNHGVQAPPGYVWLVEHRALGFDAFSQLEPWHFCGAEEILPLAKRWPWAGIKRELIPFARHQGSDDLVCFEFAAGQCIQVCHVHYQLGSPVYVEVPKSYPTVWDWLHAAVDDAQLWFDIEQQKRAKDQS